MAITALCVAACWLELDTSTSSAAASASASSSSASGSGTAQGANRSSSRPASRPTASPSRPGRPARAQAPALAGEGGGAAGSGARRRGGFFFGGGAGRGFANNPKLRAAFQACGGGQFPARRFSLNHAAVTKFVACVKAHGYTLPAPNFSGKGGIFPRNIESNKKFQTASQACASDLRPAGAPGGPGGAPPGGSSSATSTT